MGRNADGRERSNRTIEQLEYDETMSFTDQKPFIATEQQVAANWGGGKDGQYFRCGLCGHRFEVGDVVRWQYTNDVPGAYGNPLVCQKCDGSRDEVVARWAKMHKEADGRMWWFCRNEDDD